MSDSEHENIFDILKSKTDKLHIPLPNFKGFFHKPSSEEEVFKNFIGREKISKQLEEWLVNGDSGSYLVTGYRGIGKSSFVGNVLNKITMPKSPKKVHWFNISCLCFIVTFLLLFFTKYEPDCVGFLLCNYSFLVCATILTFLVCAVILAYDAISKNKKILERKIKNEGIDEADYKKHKDWFEKVLDIREIKKDKHNRVIKLNLGHEILREKDILSLLAKRIYETYEEYSNSFYANWIRIPLKTIALFVVSILVVNYFDTINIISKVILQYEQYQVEQSEQVHVGQLQVGQVQVEQVGQLQVGQIQVGKYETVFSVVSEFAKLLIKEKIIVKFILSIIFYFIIRKIFKFLVLQIPFLRKFSRSAILEKLKFLIDRTEAAVTEESDIGSGHSYSVAPVSLKFSRRKNKAYPVVSAREIEDELIQILNKIKVAEEWIIPLSKKIRERINFHPLKFIIVFDELDKIDPIYNHVVIKPEQNIPELEASMAFQGGSATRDRKQNVLKLLGNMKMFMSEAKAKFVFISGRELYDAFLADLADREFAASSIFNGVIYVDSFLESSVEEKNILTKTEEYLCRYLIPEEWYKEEVKKRYKEARKSDKISVYRNPDFRLYKQFLLETLIRDGKIFNLKGYGGELKYRDFNELENFLKNKVYKKWSSLKLIWCYLRKKIKNKTFYTLEEILKNEKSKSDKKWLELQQKLSKLEQMYLFIDKTIVFLNQFSIYLTYVCNGSPKKITLYLEHFVKPFIYENKKNKFYYCNNDAIEKSQYCLSFSVTQQQTISFVQYITYPIIQSFINQTSHFGDKVLVSISFLINHIFKHYTGGFSHENIEHTPELLEVYHIHNLRDIIDSILSFLRRNHVTNICSGVYQYKFRKPIADEIMYNSRISEEISAIFNFTLDESLPVKRYFYRQIEDIEKKYLQLKESAGTQNIKNPYADILISQLEILAEIHFSDEEYNEAMQNFQTVFEIIKSELQNHDKDENKLQLYVLLNRIALKLGKAKECKGYYNEALAIYNNLFDYLVKFAYSSIGRPVSIQNREAISRITLFSEMRAIYQAILANLFAVEKIAVTGITHENLDFAEKRFKYFYKFADSTEKFIQEADFYKKLASILFLKNYSKLFQENYSNPDVDECSKKFQQSKCQNENKNYPCCACNYIAKSLDVFKDKFKELISNKYYRKTESYFLKFLEFLKPAKTPNNYFFILASALRIKADICLSCADDNDKLEHKFLDSFFTLLKGRYFNTPEGFIDEFISFIEFDSVPHTLLSKLVKAILYYWFAAEYFSLNHSLVDSNECLQKILMIFDKYITTNNELSISVKLVKWRTFSDYFDRLEHFITTDDDMLSLNNEDEKDASDNPFSSYTYLFERIRDTIVRRVLRNNSTINDNTDRIEVPTLKYILKYGQVKKISLSYLSDVENVEEILFPYCKLELSSIDIETYYKEKESPKEKDYPIYFDCYTSRLLCGAGLPAGSTLSAKISSLEFKERMNIAIFKELFEKAIGKLLNFYDFDFSVNYSLFLTNHLVMNDTDYDKKIKKIYELCNVSGNDTSEMRINLVTFLIKDSLYCLTKIVEILSSGRLSNFSNSFTGDIYHQISKWATLYYLTRGLLKYHSDFEIFIKNEINKMCKRNNIFSDNLDEQQVAYRKKFFEAGDTLRNRAAMTDNDFEHSILDDIGQGNRHFLGPSYSVAMALKHYHNAIELHSEGKEYREMIREMYIVDDDISNGMHNFSLALERYTMNRGLIEKKIKMLRAYYKDLNYPLKNYLEEPE